MSCTRLSAHNRLEQDYWLSFAVGDRLPPVTDAQRLEFLRYDSHGGDVPHGNPILLGKARHGQFGSVLVESYFDLSAGWVGGANIVEDYIEREPFQYRPLVEWFGPEAVERWLDAWWRMSQNQPLDEVGDGVT